MPCCTYILYSASRDRYYIGATCDAMQERIRRHNSNHKGFTGASADWEIVYQEEQPDGKAAFARERELKSWKSRKRLEQLIASRQQL
ncbi:hypothetical protein GCM10028786_05720 [Flaviaesturariibacter terrae]